MIWYRYLAIMYAHSVNCCGTRPSQTGHSPFLSYSMEDLLQLYLFLSLSPIKLIIDILLRVDSGADIDCRTGQYYHLLGEERYDHIAAHITYQNNIKKHTQQK